MPFSCRGAAIVQNPQLVVITACRLNCNFHRHRDCINPVLLHVQLHQMAQHSRLHVNFQPRRTNIHFVRNHLGRPVYFRKSKIIFGLYKSGDIDLETIKSCRRVSDRQSIGNRADAMENKNITVADGDMSNDDTARYYLLLTSDEQSKVTSISRPIQF